MNRTGVAQQLKIESSLRPVQSLLQRKCACGNHTPGGGECAECALKKKNLQRKLTIGASNDPLEQEADRVAEQVMSTPLNSAVNATPPRIQRFSGQANEGSISAPASVDRVLASYGRPLEPALQHDMGQRFGHDFSQVRVHTGDAAEQSARDVNANAYTVENNIVFGAGRFAPHSNEGKRLIAHELAHTIQQNGHARPNIQREFLLEPVNNKEATATLAKKNVDAAVVFNSSFYFTKDELQLLTDLFGTQSTETDISKLLKELTQPVADFQYTFGLAVDGKLNYLTADLVIKEITRERDFVGGQLTKEEQGVVSKLSKRYATPVLYIGMNSYKQEIPVVKNSLPYADNGQFNAVAGGGDPKKVKSESTEHDITTDSGLKNFIDSLKIKDPAKADKATKLIKSKGRSGEIALVVKEYSQADQNLNNRMTRLILSGHSGGISLFGGGGSLNFDDFVTLAEIFPQASGQVQHLMVSACSAGTYDNLEGVFLKAFPNLKTFWGYYQSCPSPAGPHIGEWLRETTSRSGKLTKKGGSAGIAVWSDGIYTGNATLTKADALQRVAIRESIFGDYFKGDKIVSDPNSGELFEYFSSLRALLSRADLTEFERKKYKPIKDQVLRLRFYSSVARQFTAENQLILTDGYGGKAPDYGALTRKQALAKIATFDADATGGVLKKAEAKAKLNCLFNLSDTDCIPEKWVH